MFESRGLLLGTFGSRDGVGGSLLLLLAALDADADVGDGVGNACDMRGSESVIGSTIHLEQHLELIDE